MVTGFAGLLWAGWIQLRDGNHIFVTDWVGDMIYTFSRVPETSSTSTKRRWRHTGVTTDPDQCAGKQRQPTLLPVVLLWQPGCQCCTAGRDSQRRFAGWHDLCQRDATPVMTFGQTGQR